MAQYLCAWEGVVSNVLSESAFFSLSHILESQDDLMCSLHLAGNFYIKQALQGVHNFLADVMLPAYFLASEGAYLQWRDDGGKTPFLGRRDVILATLVEQEVIAQDMADEVTALAQAVNDAVHWHEVRTTHAGLAAGDWLGRAHNETSFKRWCELTSDAIDNGIRLMRKHLEQLDDARIEADARCIACLTPRPTMGVVDECGDDPLLHLTCERCSYTWTVDA